MGALKLDLVVPAVQIGALSVGTSAFERQLKPYLRAPVSQEGLRNRYPLALADGVSAAWPMTLPLIGGVEVKLGNDQGRLRLVVPTLLVMVAGGALHALSPWLIAGPIPTGASTTYFLRLPPGGRVSLPMGPVGAVELAVPTR